MKLSKRFGTLSVAAAAMLLSACGEQAAEAPEMAVNANAADVVFMGGDVYTVEESQPWAKGVAVSGNKIVAIFENDADADAYIGYGTRVIDLKGRMLMPGFIDGHTHFDRAGAQINDVNLLKIHETEALRVELQRVMSNIPEGEWITRGAWGAYEAWGAGEAAVEEGKGAGFTDRWKPTAAEIDDITPNTPVFVQSFERPAELYLANTAALKAAGLENEALDGMDVDENGKPTGLIYKDSPAIERINAVVQEKSHERLLNEARAGLQRMREGGIVEIHDITHEGRDEIFAELQEKGELTARVWMRADLSRAKEFNDKGIKMGSHPRTGEEDHYLRWGAYKGYIDGIMGSHGALFFEPYNDRPGYYGRYRHHTSDDPEMLEENMEKMYAYLLEANKGGFKANVHAIGTKGVALMLDTYERLQKDVGGSLEGFRVIHNQVVRPVDFPRFNQLGVIAEINPYHLSDDMRWMEERIGFERSKGAYAFNSLLKNGSTLIFASDWPGTNAAEYYNHPKYLLNAAVNRTTLQGTPEGGWFPEEKISLEESIKAYTINGAEGTFEGHVRGSIKEGKYADLVIIDRNLFNIPPADLINMEIDMTMVNGNIVYERVAN
ncbi:amidohydrolase [Pseudemcibacter aquimaris]|uniref:amidohydrolase n=1 Tax=Pseudemcibacter aquimaris TaxID=2857064 RepID=UPI002011720B|nr:amidohydrolase [Pseudemcibacter aquimaris]MCC3861857.1 amidohydrolase [Pseudemcibacter aquimaris]WDU58610.1 amidohydrolase [Pseudemcibacter aquimaris]